MTTMSFNAISCFPALTAEHPEVDFRDAKRCSFLDVLSYEANGKSEVTEGKLGTGGLEDWFSRVCARDMPQDARPRLTKH